MADIYSQSIHSYVTACNKSHLAIKRGRSTGLLQTHDKTDLPWKINTAVSDPDPSDSASSSSHNSKQSHLV